MSASDLPLEVQLAKGVRDCRDCAWFWQGTPPYGPYPGYDWLTDYPSEAICRKPQTEKSIPPWPWLEATLTEPRIVEPGIMHGCRMAPIMTVGINPNMTAWFPYSSAGGWCYPAFSKVERYAYYYRHFTLYQESVPSSYVAANIDTRTCLRATDAGKILDASRGQAHNYFELTVQYDGQPQPTVHEIAFTPGDRWVILANKNAPVAKGDLLAGCFAPKAGDKVELYENAAGYYQRMVSPLRRLEAKAGFPEGALTIGEDVAQHDMVSCASPGWQSKYDMPQATLSRHCVQDKAWVVSQFVQSQPKLVILVGKAALSMFRTVFWPFMTLRDIGSDVYDIYPLLQETCLRPTYVDIDIGPVKFKSRLLATPHFSYAENFLCQSRLSPQAWAAFKSDFSQDEKILQDAGLVKPPSVSGFIPVQLTGADDPIRSKLSAESWQILMAYFMDPFELISDALAFEAKAGNLAFDSATGHLARSNGPCRFCANAAWTFPEGCAYGKTKQDPIDPDTLKAVVEEIVARSRKQP